MSKIGAPLGNKNNPEWRGGGDATAFPHARCTFIKRDGTRCRRFRVKGTDRCPNKRHKRSRGNTAYGVQNLPRFYGRVLTETLRDRVDAQLSATHDEQLELYEELALTRESAAESVRLWAAATTALDRARERGDEKDMATMSEHVQATAALMAEHLDHVKEYAQAIARVRSLTKEKLTVHTLYGVVHQVTRLMYEVCGDENEELARMLEARLRTDVVLPVDETRGTAITPDREVIDMDDTVPDAD